jgi:hypothetical protein
VSPPTARPFPRFIADASHEGPVQGRFAERLTAEFVAACEPLAEEAGSPVEPETVRWFPDRAWAGRTFVPVTARAREPSVPADAPTGTEPILVEYYGWVSYVRPEDGEPGELRAKADFTDVTAEDNPDWQVDLSDDVIGGWRSEAGRGGEVTLVWGLPMVRGAVAATAELDGEVVDQCPVQSGDFTLVAVDAVHGFGDDVYLTVKLWDRRLRQVASESLYAEADDGDEDEDADETEPESSQESGGERSP